MWPVKPKGFSPRMTQPSGLSDPTQEQSGPVTTPRSLLGPTAQKSPMAAKVRASLMMKLRGGK